MVDTDLIWHLACRLSSKGELVLCQVGIEKVVCRDVVPHDSKVTSPKVCGKSWPNNHIPSQEKEYTLVDREKKII